MQILTDKKVQFQRRCNELSKYTLTHSNTQSEPHDEAQAYLLSENRTKANKLLNVYLYIYTT